MAKGTLRIAVPCPKRFCDSRTITSISVRPQVGSKAVSETRLKELKVPAT